VIRGDIFCPSLRPVIKVHPGWVHTGYLPSAPFPPHLPRFRMRMGKKTHPGLVLATDLGLYPLTDAGRRSARWLTPRATAGVPRDTTLFPLCVSTKSVPCLVCIDIRPSFHRSIISQFRDLSCLVYYPFLLFPFTSFQSSRFHHWVTFHNANLNYLEYLTLNTVLRRVADDDITTEVST
jgi:hypothetical protein